LSKRALRRHHLERLKRKRSKCHWGRELTDPKYIGIAVSTPKTCSGPCCGNPRKWWGEKTIQERRIEQDYS
jgi:hypothetical protein